MSELGKRYTCEKCGAVVLTIKAGEGQLACCSQPMTTDDPKPIPSGD
jgi:desulfoferrodoxin-like iron-binding protein